MTRSRLVHNITAGLLQALQAQPGVAVRMLGFSSASVSWTAEAEREVNRILKEHTV